MIIKELEARIENVAFFDIEMNSLEDAYINIAREEARLLEEIKSDGGVNLPDSRLSI